MEERVSLTEDKLLLFSKEISDALDNYFENNRNLYGNKNQCIRSIIVRYLRNKGYKI